MNASDLFGAFANPTRLRILSLLRERDEICVCDLCEVLGEPQPKVSRHLARLRESGLVDVRSRGKWKLYALAPPPTVLHQTLLRCVSSCLSDLEELVADRKRLARVDLPARALPRKAIP